MKIINSIGKLIRSNRTLFICFLLTLIFLIVMINNRLNRLEHSKNSNSETSRVIKNKFLPDFAAITPISAKKAAFFEYMRPMIRRENQKIQYDKALLNTLEKQIQLEGQHHNSAHRKLKKLAKRYRVDHKRVAEIIKTLNKRIDIIPESLVLAQSAIESSWGTSRFALQANNLFGQRCFSKGCGVIPKRRSKSLKYEVQAFQSPEESVKSYMKNLNSNKVYQEFRNIRYNLRESDRKISGEALAQGLENYSQQGNTYVSKVVSFIKQNKLE